MTTVDRQMPEQDLRSHRIIRRPRTRHLVSLAAALSVVGGCTGSADPRPPAAASPTTSALETSAPSVAAACPSAPQNPAATQERLAVEGASIPVRAGWTIRSSSPGWVAFGPGASEFEGGNLIHATCVLTEAGLPTDLPDDIVGWLLQRKDLGAKVIEKLQVDGQPGQLVSIEAESLLWCTASSSSDCFVSNRAYGVFPTSKGVIVVEGFGQDTQATIANTRALATALKFG